MSLPPSDLLRRPTRRPAVVTAAALLLGACAVLQVALFVVLAAGGADGGFLTNLWLTIALVGLAGFVVAAVRAWRGLPGTRTITWFLAFVSAPVCGTLGQGVVGLIRSVPSSSENSSTSVTGLTPDNVAAAIVLALSALSLAAALVLLTLPSSRSYFRRRPLTQEQDHSAG